jgi:uncharacterized protein DUF4177
MWNCTKCREAIDEEFQICWNCGTSKDGIENSRFKKAEEIQPDDLSAPLNTNGPLPLRPESTAIIAKSRPHEKRSPNCSPLSEKWEYFYLSRREWRERIIAKCGYRWKWLFTAVARQQFNSEQEEAIEAVLNDLGNQGWELVGLIPVTMTVFGSGGSLGAEAIFKRRIQVGAEPQSSAASSG